MNKPKRKLKYQNHLEELPNCPSESYEERTENAFRWVFRDGLTESFKPLNLIKEPPPRMLDDSDMLCKGFGLSFFETFTHAFNRYEALYQRKRGVSHEVFISEKGESIAELQMTGTEGIFGDVNKGNGHFTFHEFEETDLKKHVLSIEDIFEKNGKFRR